MRAGHRECLYLTQSIGAVFAVALLVWLVLRLAPESSPAARGANLAYTQNCIECHGRAEASAVADENLTCRNRPSDDVYRHYQGACRDYLAYFEIVRLNRNFALRTSAQVPNHLLQGEKLARQYGCFQCHGQMGQGGLRNAGALKAYVPGYFGRDFKALTLNGNRESIIAWIRHGIDPALTDSWLTGYFARIFLERQAVSMPQFKSLPDNEIRLLTDYLIALHQYGEMDAGEIRDYSRRTISPPGGQQQ